MLVALGACYQLLPAPRFKDRKRSHDSIVGARWTTATKWG